MKIWNIEPGSADWLEHRLGIPTASNFHKIITPAKLQFSKQSREYAFYLIAEKLLNRSLSSLDHIEWVEYGKMMEPEAIRMYELVEEVETLPVGFITDREDDPTMGATPDRLIAGQPAALEIKCPSPQVHVGYMVDGFGSDYMAQVQGQMLVGEFEWVDRYAYSPEMPPVLVRTHRDEAFITALRGALTQFNDMRMEMLEAVKAKGYFAERKHVMTAVDELGGEAHVPL